MYDLVILGGGPGGYGAAEYAARLGLGVALVERDRLGGTCLNRGCVPTKAYLHTAEAVREASAFAPGLPAQFDRAAMLKSKNETVDTLVKGIGLLMKAGKVAVYEGQGTLLNAESPFSVQVMRRDGASETLQGRAVLIATGSEPSRLPLPGCDNPALWTSDDLLGEAGAQPFQSLLIVGGGVIGVEMACVYARLGVAVTVVEAEKRCLPMMDLEISRSAEALLKGLGVTVLTDAHLERIDSDALHGGFTATYRKDNASGSAWAERALMATGRRPVTDGLLGEGVSLAMNRRAIAVDEHFRTSIAGVYAIGDVNGVFQLAHAAHAQGVASVSHFAGVISPINPSLVPSCVYTAPEIASVGLTQEEAKARGLEVVVGKALTTQNARTLIEGLGRGFIKLLFDRPTRKLVGAQLFCGRATDMIGELTVAIENGLTAEALLRPLRPHPTFEESITDAVLSAKFD